MDFEQTVNNRHSIRLYLDQQVEQEKVDQILKTVNFCPTAGNLQAYRIFIVKKTETKKLLAQAALDQEFIQEAPLVLVFCANQEESAQKYGERGKNLYALQDATIAAAYAQLSATSQGLGSVWVGAFDPKEVKSILGITNLLPIAILPIGYPAEKNFFRDRKEIADIIIED